MIIKCNQLVIIICEVLKVSKKPLSIRLPGDMQVDEVDAVAQRRGMSRAAFVVNAIELLMGFDDVFLKKMEAYAKGLNIPLFLVMQNRLIKLTAQEAAEAEVRGPSRRLLDEFMYTNEGTITGEELFRMLKAHYVKEKRRAYDEEMGERVHVKRASGIELSDEEKAWVESLEQAAKRVREQEESKKLIHEQLEEELGDEAESFSWTTWNPDDEGK